MKTDLPVGTLILFRHNSVNELWKVATASTYGGVQRPIVPGEVIHRCVWKGGLLLSRESYTVKDGDVAWVDTGIMQNGNNPGRGNIFVNEFADEGVPAWLRGAR